ncbi:sensor histidine kinase [Hymenobacter sp. B81]|uniref:sensor histidine kinase n=1 Tax=Hymenobacter sp. B81 TaxID=3344878 RepID=UPI0037DC6946
MFYANSHWLLPAFYKRGRYLLYALALLAVFGLYALLRYFINGELLPALAEPMLRPVDSLKMFWAQTLSRGIYFLLLSCAYWFARNAIRLEKQKRLQEEQLRLTEKSLLEAEVAFLRSQINPHFLFNALNFLYAQVYPLSESSAKGILLLSDIMRYALKEAGDNGKVMLEEEVHHLQNYIAINQLRFSNSLQIRFEQEGSCQFLMILPLVLITFVENCFKHGELSDAREPLLIRLRVEAGQLYFYTHNRKRHGPKEKTTGIGLANTRKRLDVIYPNRYSLQVDNAPDHYTCTLTLDL